MPAPDLTIASLAPIQSAISRFKGLRCVKEYKDTTNDDRDDFDPLVFTTAYNASITTYTFRVGWKYFYPDENVQSAIAWDDPTTGAWSLLQALDNAYAAGKGLNLLLTSGADTPAWVKTLVPADEKENFDVPGPRQPPCVLLPVPWSVTYRTYWHAFIDQVAARVANHPALDAVGVSGATSNSMEPNLPHNTADACVVGAPMDATVRWVELGYTSTKNVSAWHEDIVKFRKAFPRVHISHALHPALGIGPNGEQAVSYKSSVRQEIIDKYMSLVPGRFALQTSGLSGGEGESGYDLIALYDRRAYTGFQFSTSCARNPTKMGDPLDPVNAAYLTINNGLAANAKYIEIYQKDWLATDIGITPPVVGKTFLQVFADAYPAETFPSYTSGSATTFNDLTVTTKPAPPALT
jgi:hypothetical protein